MNYSAYAALVNGGEKQVSGPRVPCQIRLRPSKTGLQWETDRTVKLAAQEDVPSCRVRYFAAPDGQGLAGRDARGASVGGASGADQTELGGSTICGKSRSIALWLRRPGVQFVGNCANADDPLAVLLTSQNVPDR
jgi:hypothetical protein